MWRFLFVFFRVPLFSIASGAAVALSAASGNVFFPIESSLRGTDFLNTFSSFSRATGTTTPEMALQTTITYLPLPPNSNKPYGTYQGIQNGIISYAQAITSTTYNTLLIVSYLYPNSATKQYVVVPAEQILDLLYFFDNNHLPSSNGAFTASPIPGTIPYYSVDPRQRAADIGSVITQLLKTPFKETQSQIWMEVTLTGPFTPQLPTINYGSNTVSVLQNVTAVSLTNNILTITFQPNDPRLTYPPTVIVTPEQVQRIIYVRYPNTPSTL